MLKEQYIKFNCPITNVELTILLLHTINIDPNKKTIVFLHGIGSNTDQFKDLFENIYVLNNIQIIGINMVGNGYSSEIPNIIMNLRNIDLLNYFTKILDLILLELNYNKFYKNIHLVGHSFGAFLASYYANFHNFVKLTLIAPIGIFETTSHLGYYCSLLFKSGFVDLIYKLYNLNNNKFKFKNNTYINKFISFDSYGTESYWNFTQFDLLTKLDTPVQLIYGYNDYIVPLQQSFLIYSLRKHNNLSTILNIILHTSHDTLSLLHNKNNNHEYKSCLNINKTNIISTNIYHRLLQNITCKLSEDIFIYYDDSYIKHLFI